MACQSGSIYQLIDLLIKHGADLSTQNTVGNSCLHYCFALGYDNIGKWLISKGADEFAVNKHGYTCYEGLSSDCHFMDDL